MHELLKKRLTNEIRTDVSLVVLKNICLACGNLLTIFKNRQQKIALHQEIRESKVNARVKSLLLKFSSKEIHEQEKFGANNYSRCPVLKFLALVCHKFPIISGLENSRPDIRLDQGIVGDLE